MNSKIYCAYPEHASKLLYWLPMDTKKLFKYNLKYNYHQLKQNNWLDSKIEYRFNSNGFRCQEFSEDPSIIFLGCSYTLGVGLNLNDTFSKIVANSLGLKNFNLGLAGGSNSSCFRIGHYWIPKLRPRLVINMATFKERFEIIKNFKPERLSLIKERKKHYEFMYDWASNELNSELDYLKNIYALEKICIDNNIKFLNFTVEKDLAVYFQGDRARDLAHFGSKTHEKTAYNILDQIDTIIT